ncbi:MAG TPA: tyrosine-type recombinase/integrase [Mycobacteriales bacterium]|nr:tyrosine-type recombinase/integrase [Mycobacteriales bacterium]
MGEWTVCADAAAADGGDGALVALHVTDFARAEVVPRFVVGVAAAVAARAGLRDGQPFVLGADGRYDVVLNRFFRELDGWGVRAPNSVAGYARDVMLFARFLHESRGGKAIWACDGADLRAYKQVRLRTPGPTQVSVGTWRRSIAALNKWVAWALAEDVIAREPFRYRDATVWTPHGMKQVRVNAESEPDPGPAPVRFVCFADYLTWRDVGLRGRFPDGRADPSWRGRHDERNAAFADLLVSTGMRLSEGASLLVGELPAHRAVETGRLSGIQLSAAVTKRNRARTVFPSPRCVRALHRYVRIERDELVTRIRAGGGYRLGEDSVAVARAGPLTVTFAGGGSVPYTKLDPATRAQLRLLTPAGELAGPLAVWLSTDGTPVTTSGWQSVFARANARCARFDLDVRISPHTLRHSYAVHMLGLLLRQTVAALGEPPASHYTSAAVKRLLVGNPLRTLQRLLGHSGEATVYVYLDVLDDAQEIVAAALGQWDAQEGALAAAGPDDAPGAGGES